LTTSTTHEPETAQASAAAAEKLKAPKKARVTARKPPVAAPKAKSANKPSPAKKGAQASKQPESPRHGSKTAKVLDLLKRSGGATLKELQKATGWQPHSLRGFLSGTLRKKMKLRVTSTKAEDEERSYSVQA
jgi:hypothetical protein